MRPVNLIPSDERRGASRGSAQSTGYAPYILLGVLAFAVLGVYLVVSAGNQVSEKQAKLDQLDQQAQQAQGKVKKTAPAGSVKTIAQARFDAVSAAVDRRFNFERRLRQLSHVLPENVALTALTATVTPGADSAAGDASGAAAGATNDVAQSGPALKMTLCSPSGDWSTVAVVLTRMRNIDGVIKVDMGGELATADSSSGSGGGVSSAGSCPASEWSYEVTVGFDAGAGGGSSAATATASGPATATEQAQSAVTKSDQANGAAGADQSAGGAGQ